MLMASPPPPAIAATDDDPSFVLTQNDLEFILRNIQISEAHAADVLDPSNYELLCDLPDDLAQNCVNDAARPAGVRTVDGSFNNLLIDQSEFGAADNVFPRLLGTEWRQADPEVLDLGFEANAPGISDACDPGTTCYEQIEGNVYDAHPRQISNLIVDQTTDNPAIVNQLDAGTAIPVPGTNRVIIPNSAPDEALSAPFNTFLGFFGQFFDHGLDLVRKGGNGTLIVPLDEDDPLFCTPEGVRVDGIDCDPDTYSNFLTLSRATRFEDSTEHTNLTSPFIDQNQTYASVPSHQVFLREYELVDGVPAATGRLIEGVNGGMSKWRDLKNQARDILGINLTDADLLDVPQIAVDPYGNFIPGANGYPQYVVEGGGLVSAAPGGVDVPDNVLGTGHGFLDDIAHGATPVIDDDGNLVPRFDENGDPILDENGEPVLTGYDNAILNEHFMAGDGRVNENIGLTAVHHVFHSEHNRMAGQIEDVLNGLRPELEAQDSDERGGIAEFAKAFRGEPHSYASDKAGEDLPGYFPAGGDPASLPDGWNADDWSYHERLFQAAKFATEMQYQHLVFEEFGRKIAPQIDPIVGNENSYNAAVDASITAEFAHVVYRFGHSLMTEEIGREAVEGGAPMEDVPLLTGFLNPELFDENGTLSPDEAAGSLINGMTGRVGSQIDEHVVDVLRNNLLGLPLDLPTMNLLRGRDTGVPGLQEARATFFGATGDPALRPYTSWDDFGRNTKNGDNFGRGGERASLVNFIAAYGTHPTVQAATTIDEKREAASLLVNGAPAGQEFTVRLAGTDRFQTAATVSQRSFPDGGPVPVAYITNGMNFPDGLAGGAAARAEGGPLLLATHSVDGEIPSATAAELARLQPERIVILGGTGAISAETQAVLTNYATSGVVERLGGATRFETAVAISQQFANPGVERVFVANGFNFPDALSAAAVAARDGSPILLTAPDALDGATLAEIDRLDPTEIVLLGGTGVVGPNVESQVTGLAPTVTRIGGADRFITSALISETYFPDGAASAFITTGFNFPDALAAGPAAGLAGAPILVSFPTVIPGVVMTELDRLNPSQIAVVGLLGAVSLAAEQQLQVFAPAPVEAPADRLDFLFSTGAWAGQETGLGDVDFWMGGLAERLDPFGGMLGSTFNYVFETQLEKLQFGDRFYYLFRNQGEQLFAALEGNTFSDLIQRNTDASNLPADIFALQDPIVDIDEQAALPAGEREPGLSLINGQWRWQTDAHVEMHGTAGDDNLRGDEGDDSIWGYDGNDRIEGGSGNDALVGGLGDDILTDSFGDDNIKGKQGNDAINTGSGIDLAIGGLGDDFMVDGGGEASTYFAGIGDDIILGTTGRITVFGGEFDDWLEGGGHADLLQGDNGDQFQNDTLGGNDVVLGRLGNDDVEGEGGDDIIVGTQVGTNRHLGGLGWDWLTYYGQTANVTADMAFTRLFEPNNPLRSRYEQLEALSGGSGNDTLRGPLVAQEFAPNELPHTQATEASLQLVDGLVEMLRPTVDGVPQDFSTPFMRGTDPTDIVGMSLPIIGGPGNDLIEGRGGDDYIDGDAMLRVRLTAGGNFFDSAAQLRAAVFAGQLNPGDIDIARDIVVDPNAATAIDTAMYVGSVADYLVEPIGSLTSGYTRVTHTAATTPANNTGTDVLHGIERIQFADACIQITAGGDWVNCNNQVVAVVMDSTDPVEGTPVTAQLFQSTSLGVATATPFDTTGVTNLRFTWWGGDGEAPNAITDWQPLINPLGSSSPTYVPDADSVDLYLRVVVSLVGADSVYRQAASPISDTPVLGTVTPPEP
ncbi:cell wall-binding repeat-containing protein [Microbacterium hominis]|uniref:Cell wall-binding repeat-containing protein n=1 Tax=Microbacterium hominis TaxID=162426 RepID=A0A7D4Q7P4_9MICO|nr:cell wall-binding repeat-containing protein [Microbacterium hominis]QKJ19199.1 cell wall-binding repeat-containing protein [Microbacterium hominis]